METQQIMYIIVTIIIIRISNANRLEYHDLCSFGLFITYVIKNVMYLTWYFKYLKIFIFLGYTFISDVSPERYVNWRNARTVV